MKILTIASTPFFSNRGCHLRIYNEAKGLTKLGYQVQICTYHNGRNLSELDIQRITPVSWYQKISPGFAWGKIWLDWKLFWLVKKQIKIFSPDILHCHLYESLAIGFFAQIFSSKKIPLLFDLQGDLESEFKNYNPQNNFLIKIFSFFSQFFLKKASAIVISSQQGKEILEKKFPWLKNITLIQDGIDLDLFSQNQTPPEKIYQELEKIKLWKKNSRILIYAGGLSSAKGLWDFFLFFGKNFSQKENWKFLIFGSGEEKKIYQETIEKNNWQSKIFLTENNDYFQLPFYLNLADIAIDPKNNSSESSGKLPIYMANNLPILCFDNQFNRAKLKEQGCYFKVIKETKKILTNNNFPNKPVNYDLKNLNNQKEMEKLEKVLKKIIKI